MPGENIKGGEEKLFQNRGLPFGVLPPQINQGMSRFWAKRDIVIFPFPASI
jgi:hypothetical protein